MEFLNLRCCKAANKSIEYAESKHRDLQEAYQASFLKNSDHSTQQYQYPNESIIDILQESRTQKILENIRSAQQIIDLNNDCETQQELPENKISVGIKKKIQNSKQCQSQNQCLNQNNSRINQKQNQRQGQKQNIKLGLYSQAIQQRWSKCGQRQKQKSKQKQKTKQKQNHNITNYRVNHNQLPNIDPLMNPSINPSSKTAAMMASSLPVMSEIFVNCMPRIQQKMSKTVLQSLNKKGKSKRFFNFRQPHQHYNDQLYQKQNLKSICSPSQSSSSSSTFSRSSTSSSIVKRSTNIEGVHISQLWSMLNER